MGRTMMLLAVCLVWALPAIGQDLAGLAVKVLQKNCVACHGAGLKASKLDLSTREAILTGGERGAAMVPNYPEKSRLYQLALHAQNPSMPPGKKLAADDLDVLKRWILAGAPWPAAVVSRGEADAKAAMRAMEERPITPEERAFWAFRQPVRPAIPSTGDANPVDAFLKKTWLEKKLTPAPEADRRTLVRRAYLDLLGLPPTPAEVDAFLGDRSPEAWEKLVDKLLASPHYGERWGRFWLDLVRYSDSGGYEYDRERHNGWRYRDWVVDAFNKDKPYDAFIREQIAGDEYPAEGEARASAMVATGFLRLGPENNLKTEMTRQDELDDIVATTSLAFLGMTVGCARCHNHKFDPIPQKDYYRIQSVFFSTKPQEYPLVGPEVVERHKAENARIDGLQKPHKAIRAEIEKPHRAAIFEEKVSKLAPWMQEAWRTPESKRTDGQRLNARQIEKTLQVKDEEIVERMSAAERDRYNEAAKAIAELDSQRPKPFPSAMAIAEQGRDPLPSYFLHRGSPDNKGSQMEPGAFTVASWGEFESIPPPEGASTSYRRRSFAEWVASPRNPLTARVMANRIWQRHFGRGIVGTANNFGKKGDPPTHPELLDWLATEFVRTGWSVKAMDKLMLMSKAYRMASDDVESSREIDGTNRYLWRMPRQRLDIETIRDAMLAAAGTLDPKLGGPAMYPYIDPALFQGSSKRTWTGQADDDPSTWRRSLYVFNKRSIRYPLFESFDQPDMITSCARRNTSVTAPQALLMMNNASIRLQAQQFAQRLRREAAQGDARDQVKLAFSLALARMPSGEELTSSVDFVQSSKTGLADFCQALFNLNEFVYTP
ncbi:MAG: PSD1 and planctomycete cytochrome C domain-containing protein [Bryobacteraceae bacterium]